MLLLDDINVLVSYCLCYIRIILFYMHSVILLFNPGVIKFICAYYGLLLLCSYRPLGACVNDAFVMVFIAYGYCSWLLLVFLV